jgi:peptidoglycan hydrolase-like protein with peptidoglycan-binding domain
VAPPAAAEPSRSAAVTGPSGPALVGAIQQELKRVGCLTGAVDRKWGGPGTARAVRDFARYARIDAPDLPAPEFLDALKGKTSRVCPLACSPRQILRDGACVAKTCPRGERLDADGDCVEIAKPKPKQRAAPAKPQAPKAAAKPARTRQAQPAKAAAAPARGGIRGCFSVSGLSFCQ